MVWGSADPRLEITDNIACQVLEQIMNDSPQEIKQQMADNIKWIKGAQENKLVVGSQACILYDEGRMIASAFNKAITEGVISGPVILGRDHHDVSEQTVLIEKHQIFMMVLLLQRIWLFIMLLYHLEAQHGLAL